MWHAIFIFHWWSLGQSLRHCNSKSINLFSNSLFNFRVIVLEGSSVGSWTCFCIFVVLIYSDGRIICSSVRLNFNPELLKAFWIVNEIARGCRPVVDVILYVWKNCFSQVLCLLYFSTRKCTDVSVEFWLWRKMYKNWSS